MIITALIEPGGIFFADLQINGLQALL